MKKFLIALCLTGLVWWQIGCGRTVSDNQRTASSNQASPSEINSNEVITQETPLPEFTDAETALAEGNKLFDLNKTELAIAAYNQAVKLNPDLAEAWFKLGVAYSLIEKMQELEAINNQENYTPTPTPALTKKGKKEQVIRTKDSEKAFEKAIAAYQKIIAQNPKDDVAYYNLGRAYEKLDEDEEAEKALKKAVELKPESSEYQTEYGAILFKLAQYERAVRVLKKALELDPENAEAEELLEKAEAGKKRINFSITPKPQQTKQPGVAPKTEKTDKTEETQPTDKGQVQPAETKDKKENQ